MNLLTENMFYHELDTSWLSNGLDIFLTSDKELDHGLNTGSKYYGLDIDPAAFPLLNWLDNGMKTGSKSYGIDISSTSFTLFNGLE